MESIEWFWAGWVSGAAAMALGLCLLRKLWTPAEPSQELGAAAATSGCWHPVAQPGYRVC